jgi:hypothetical protein
MDNFIGFSKLLRLIFPDLIVNQVKDQSSENDSDTNSTKQSHHWPEVHALEQTIIAAEIPMDKETNIHDLQEKKPP